MPPHQSIDFFWGETSRGGGGGKRPVGAKRPGAKRPEAKRPGGETSKGRNWIWGKTSRNHQKYQNYRKDPQIPERTHKIDQEIGFGV